VLLVRLPAPIGPSSPATASERTRTSSPLNGPRPTGRSGAARTGERREHVRRHRAGACRRVHRAVEHDQRLALLLRRRHERREVELRAREPVELRNGTGPPRSTPRIGSRAVGVGARNSAFVVPGRRVSATARMTRPVGCKNSIVMLRRVRVREVRDEPVPLPSAPIDEDASPRWTSSSRHAATAARSERPSTVMSRWS
jgi:hypothetical protein